MKSIMNSGEDRLQAFEWQEYEEFFRSHTGGRDRMTADEYVKAYFPEADVALQIGV
jgi:hypothetical protein